MKDSIVNLATAGALKSMIQKRKVESGRNMAAGSPVT